MSEGRHGLPSGASVLRGAVFAFSAVYVCIAPASQLRAGETTVIEGIPHVRNATQPPGGRVTIAPRELWRVGGGDDEMIFGNIARIDRNDAGDFYILDTQLCEVTVLSGAGEFKRTLGRSGEGPGELYRPADFFLRVDGGVGLMQQFPGKVVLVDGEGEPAGSFALSSGAGTASSFMALVDSRSRDGRVVIGGIEMAFEGALTRQTYFLSAVDEAGVRQKTYLSKQNTISFADFVASEQVMDFVWWGQRWTMTPSGQVLANPERNLYRIERYDTDAKLLSVIEREYESWQRTGDERIGAERVLRAAVSGYPTPPRSLVIEPTDPDVSAIYPREDGSFWIRTSRGDRPDADATLTVIDVYDADGNFTHEIELEMPGNIGQDALYVCGDRILQVTNSLDAFISGQPGGEETDEDKSDEQQELEIVCFALGDL